MKYHLILENAAGEQADLSTTANRYMMSKVTGLDPPGATISTATYATMNGSKLNRAFLEKRNIVISFEMRGTGIEKRRHKLYRVAKPSEYIKVYYRTSNIDVYAEGVVETCEPSRFDMPVSGQISILCPDVYFYSTQDTIVQHSSIVSGFKFPFAIAEKPGVPLGVYQMDSSITIQNNGDPIGMEITMEAKGGTVSTPTIYNADTGAYLRITGNILEGDKITITTKHGHRTVTLTRNGVSISIMNRWVSGSEWLELPTGESHFYITALLGLKYLIVTFRHTDAYLGV
ncbi:phage tail domain-containing protein [uncultured Ruminococcus sp.]|uniref:phage distal tail protein n=1 Tax=uncultured Ruminococcus sp. TaxID=165186 RepID=UPI0025D4B066|nr:phage tail domain-containing protein [uncultured Ruminococcus sp.]